MATYMKKPIKIEAFKILDQYTYPKWFEDKITSGEAISVQLLSLPPKFAGYDIKTLEGIMRADVGNYIIKGVKGEIYCVREDIFLETYDEIK